MKNVIDFVVALVAFLVVPSILFSQTEGASFTLTGMGVATPFASDYQSLGINPGNLGRKNQQEKIVTLGFAEGGLSLYSEALKKEEVRQNILQKKAKDLTQEEKRDYAILFTNSRNALNIDMTSLGISLQTKRFGTFAFNTQERMKYYSKLGDQVSDLLWLGYNSDYFDKLVLDNQDGTFDTIPNLDNLDPAILERVVQGIKAVENAKSISELIQGTSFHFSWIQEYNLGWGMNLLSREKMQLFGGIGGKLMVGRGITEINAQGGTADVFGALAPIFNINYGDVSTGNPSAFPSNAPKLKPVGFGYGIDLGATAVFHDKFILSAAVTDIGSMKWDGNIYTLKDIDLLSIDNNGLESTDFIEQIQNFSGGDGLLAWQGTQSKTTKLLSTMRTGFGFDNAKNLRLGVDVIVPLSNSLGNIENPVIAVGGEFSPIPQIHLQAGLVQGGNYDMKIPVGIYFTLGSGTYEFGVASRDLVTFFRNNQPTVSLAFGFLRFRF